MQIYDFLLEQSCISRCLTLVASQISNFIADTNHFCSVENLGSTIRAVFCFD